MLIQPKSKNGLFESFRHFASTLDDAGFGYQPVDSSALLRSIKMVGPEFSYPGYFSMHDETFLLSVISALKHARIPLNAEFSGSFDSLKEGYGFSPSDFLLSDETADILTINYVIGLPQNYDHNAGNAFRGAVAIRELSSKHFDQNAWKNAAERHQAKMVFVLGGETEIHAAHLLGDKYTYLTSFVHANKVCSVAIDRDYLKTLQAMALNTNSPLAQAVTQHKPSALVPAA